MTKATEERPEDLEKSKKDKDGKDLWDKLQIIGTLLIPASIGVAGLLYSNAMQRAQIESASIQNEREVAIASINAQVNQAQLLSTFMDALSGSQPLKRAIAINAVLIGVPVQGKQIVELISKNDTDKPAQLVAVKALVSRRTELITNLYSTDKSTRVAAGNEISNTWINDQATVDQMINTMNYALDNPGYYSDADNGIYNCLALLRQADKKVLKDKRQAFDKLFSRLPKENTKTIQLAQDIQTKIKDQY